MLILLNTFVSLGFSHLQVAGAHAAYAGLSARKYGTWRGHDEAQHARLLVQEHMRIN